MHFERKVRPNKMEAEAVAFLLAAIPLPKENSRFRIFALIFSTLITLLKRFFTLEMLKNINTGFINDGKFSYR